MFPSKEAFRISKFLGKKMWRNAIAFGIIVFSCPLSTKSCLIFILISFVREIKRFYQSSSGNDVDLRDKVNVSSNILNKD